jgi:hypothetical protein
MPSDAPFSVEIRLRSITTAGERSGVRRQEPSADAEAAVAGIVAAAPAHGGQVGSSVEQHGERGVDRHHGESVLGEAQPRYFDGFPPDVLETVRVFLVSIGTADGLHSFLESAKTMFTLLAKPAPGAIPAEVVITVGALTVKVADSRDLGVAMTAAAQAAEIERARVAALAKPPAPEPPLAEPKRLLPVDGPKRLLDDATRASGRREGGARAE